MAIVKQAARPRCASHFTPCHDGKGTQWPLSLFKSCPASPKVQVNCALNKHFSGVTPELLHYVLEIQKVSMHSPEALWAEPLPGEPLDRTCRRHHQPQMAGTSPQGRSTQRADCRGEEAEWDKDGKQNLLGGAPHRGCYCRTPTKPVTSRSLCRDELATPVHSGILTGLLKK